MFILAEMFVYIHTEKFCMLHLFKNCTIEQQLWEMAMKMVIFESPHIKLN